MERLFADNQEREQALRALLKTRPSESRDVSVQAAACDLTSSIRSVGSMKRFLFFVRPSVRPGDFFSSFCPFFLGGVVRVPAGRVGMVSREHHHRESTRGGRLRQAAVCSGGGEGERCDAAGTGSHVFFLEKELPSVLVWFGLVCWEAGGAVTIV